MSWLLTDQEFATAGRAANAGEVTPALYAFVYRLVYAVAMSHTLAPALSPTGKWDDSDDVQETVQEWFAHRLPKTLRRAFDRTETPATFSKYLEVALRNWLISRARSQGQPRLRARAREIMMAEPEFAQMGSTSSAADELWGLTGWHDRAPFAADDRRLARAAFAASELQIVRSSAGSKLPDPVLSTGDLKALLLSMFQELEQPLRVRDIDRALKGRFGFAYSQEEVELEDVPSVADHELPALDQLELEDATRELLAELTGRQVAIVRDRINDKASYDELSRRHGVSRGTIQNELARAETAVRAHTPEGVEPSQVLEMLVDLRLRR